MCALSALPSQTPPSEPEAHGNNHLLTSVLNFPTEQAILSMSLESSSGSQGVDQHPQHHLGTDKNEHSLYPPSAPDPGPRPAESETLRVSPQNLHFPEAPGAADAHSSVRASDVLR